jgi:hypothetical protein
MLVFKALGDSTATGCLFQQRKEATSKSALVLAGGR